MSQFSREKPIPQIVQDAGSDFHKLLAALKYPDFEVREAAAWALGKVGTFECIIHLVNALKDPDAVVRESACYALGEIKDLPNLSRKLSVFEDTPPDIQAMNELVKTLKDRENRVRIAASKALVTYGKHIDPAPIDNGTNEGNQSKTTSLPPGAIFAYSNAVSEAPQPSQPRSYPPLKRNKPIPQQVLDANYDFVQLELCSHHKEMAVREAAIWVLGVMADPRGVQIIVQGLHDPEPVVRETSARALGQIRYPNDTKKSGGRFEDMTEDRKAADGLLHTLKDKETNVRASAAAALANYGKPEVTKVLITMLSEQIATLRAAAATGLGGCPYPEVIPALIHVLRDDDFFARLCAARSLGRLGDSQALNPLLELLHDQNASVRLNTARALADLGFRGVGTTAFWRQTIDVLIALGTSDSSEEVQAFAQDAVIKLQKRLIQ